MPQAIPLVTSIGSPSRTVSPSNLISLAEASRQTAAANPRRSCEACLSEFECIENFEFGLRGIGPGDRHGRDRTGCERDGKGPAADRTADCRLGRQALGLLQAD